MEKRCEECNTTFSVSSRYRQNANKYCSKPCYWDNMKGRTPWNKGNKGVMKPNKTSFKRGSEHTDWKGGTRSWLQLEAKRALEKHYGISWNKMYKPNDAVIHHISGDNKDNRFENLCIISRSEHAQLHNLQGDIGRWRQ